MIWRAGLCGSPVTPSLLLLISEPAWWMSNARCSWSDSLVRSFLPPLISSRSSRSSLCLSLSLCLILFPFSLHRPSRQTLKSQWAWVTRDEFNIAHNAEFTRAEMHVEGAWKQTLRHWLLCVYLNDMRIKIPHGADAPQHTSTSAAASAEVVLTRSLRHFDLNGLRALRAKRSSGGGLWGLVGCVYINQREEKKKGGKKALSLLATFIWYLQRYITRITIDSVTYTTPRCLSHPSAPDISKAVASFFTDKLIPNCLRHPAAESWCPSC